MNEEQLLNTPMFFENISDLTVSISINDTHPIRSKQKFEVSSDNENWTPVGVVCGLPILLPIGSGERLYIRNAEDVGYVNTSNTNVSFSSDGDVAVGGNIMSLCFHNFIGKTALYEPYAIGPVFKCMEHLKDASDLVLPATVLSDYCYAHMFSACESLMHAPKTFPATQLANHCYYFMFYKCTSLITAPELPSTTLATGCYSNMFYECTALTKAPELPATKLENCCYMRMFMLCTSLEVSPKLPATQLADSCYYGMFSYCESMVTAPDLPATEFADDCYAHMFNGCESLSMVSASTKLILSVLTSEYCDCMFCGCNDVTTITPIVTPIV